MKRGGPSLGREQPNGYTEGLLREASAGSEEDYCTLTGVLEPIG